MPTCGRCRAVPAAPGEAWCVNCLADDDPADYVAGVHVDHLDPTERPWQPVGR